MDQTGKVYIEVGKGVRWINLPTEAKKKVIKDLRFDNPKYISAEKHGGYVSSSVDRYIKFFKIYSDRKTVWTPRGYIWYLKKWLKNNNYKIKIRNRTLVLPKINIKFKGVLRDYQDLGVTDVVNRYPVGVLEAATGAGKTVMGTAIIARRKQPTLIIVHTKELLYQWQSSIKKFLDYDCGLLGDSKCDIKDITVGIINTVRNKIDLLAPKFGHIICDEAHRCPSTTWTDCLVEFPAKYYLGLTATAFRKDGLGHAIFAHIGPKVHKVNKKKLHETGAVLKPKIFKMETDFRAARSAWEEEAMNYSSMIKKLTEDDERNILITRTITSDLSRFHDNILVVSDRVSHCQKIADILNRKGLKNHVLSGKTANGKRKSIVADVKAGKCKILIATLSLIGEGFDAPNLTTLLLTTPIKFSGRLIQTVGRVLRPEKGKVPRVYDFRDNNVRVLRYSGFHRDRIYRKEWS